jgi:hypothetical protein
MTRAPSTTSGVIPALIIIRGNSASGKTSAAQEIRRLYGRGIAIVSQDVLRRDILYVKDEPVNPAIGLIDLTARYALNHGYHAIVEGIMSNASYGGMLSRLVQDHVGESACFYYDLSFHETVLRHTRKPQAAEYGEDLMREWYRERDLIPALQETILGPDVSLDAAVSVMMEAVGLHFNTRREHPCQTKN